MSALSPYLQKFCQENPNAVGVDVVITLREEAGDVTALGLASVQAIPHMAGMFTGTFTCKQLEALADQPDVLEIVENFQVSAQTD